MDTLSQTSTKRAQRTISIVVPAYNEAQNLPIVYAALLDVFASLPEGTKYAYELVFVDDGSRDDTAGVIQMLAAKDTRVVPVIFSRNFGKEAATSAGLAHATGDAVIIMDADMQHPPRLIPLMLAQWHEGYEQVVGIRTKHEGQGRVKALFSGLFYSIMQKISEVDIERGETDFRLLDRQVVDAFNALPERQRMVRTLLNWVGFRRTTIEFVADERAYGVASYSTIKLVRLALHSFVSNSLLPLRATGYLGIVITTISFPTGLAIFAQRYIFNDALNWGITGSAQLAIILVFLIGIVLTALGLIALYIENIHKEAIDRPLYVVRPHRTAAAAQKKKLS